MRVLSALRVFVFACVVIAAACGGDEEQPPATPPTNPPPSGGGTNVTGSERIAWSQTIRSGQNIQQFRFVAYIDSSSRTNLNGVQCASPSGGVSQCSAALPPMTSGRHTLQLAAIDPAGVESSPSEALVLNVVSRVSTSAPPVEGLLRQTCVGMPEPACYTLEVLVHGLERPTGLVATGDGRLLFVDRRSELYLLDSGRLTLALQLPGGIDATIESIALAADFDQSRFVYAAIAETRATGRTMSIVRFREAGGTLGEQAVIVPGIAIAGSGPVALSVGAGNDLYLAVPAAEAGDTNAETGVILAFDSSGASKGQMASPVLAEGSPRPAKLAWQDGRLLLASFASKSAPALGQLLLGDGSVPGLRALRAEPVEVLGFPASGWGARDLAVHNVHGNERAAMYVVAEEPRVLYRVVADEAGALTPAIVALGSPSPEVVATSPNGEIYVGATVGSDSAKGVILRLRPNDATRRALPR